MKPLSHGKKHVKRFRTIWISDVHLGTTGCQAARLLEFLQATESETLYLVGDIIDGWQLKRRWYWDQTHNNVVQNVLKKAKKGTQVIFVPGNHDESIRQFIDLDFGGIRIRDELVHITAQGKRMLVLHGDRFDGVIACAKWLAYVGDSLYTMILKFNQVFNAWRARAGLPYWSLSQYLKLKVKNAVSYITSFEHALATEAKRKGLDGVICGHIHKPEIREIEGITYCNDGDWVESLSALVEDMSGELRLVTWHDIIMQKQEETLGDLADICVSPS
ncbi:MAG TPA: UDP-2,3-diacylglucosamine diphosphatase [Noviherbaspirillum sp.]|nr:UDP-2,3-diacylglucosamine diphosphatase [Noviherbaspirillum sp.]